jgi:hypothetical protein
MDLIGYPNGYFPPPQPDQNILNAGLSAGMANSPGLSKGFMGRELGNLKGQIIGNTENNLTGGTLGKVQTSMNNLTNSIIGQTPPMQMPNQSMRPSSSDMINKHFNMQKSNYMQQPDY